MACGKAVSAPDAAQDLWDSINPGAVGNRSPAIFVQTIGPRCALRTNRPTRPAPNSALGRPDSQRRRSAKLARPDSRLTTVTQSPSMTQYRQAADKTLQAMFLIEEACLTALLEHRAWTGDQDGMSTQEIAECIGLVRWLGPDVGDAAVGKVLCNLARSYRTEPVPETHSTAKWRITVAEAAIRPMPVMDVTAQSIEDGSLGQGHGSDQ